ncbi:hypothetical protein CH278_19670 [Rhodococcus sp. 05-2254-5]|uniref:tyrosine-type recombinase/integrase n=1 Tax=unclassified Rhodococcus (in: high G+C Gram-positive bacteria) TaxID=192944 RepID=UPI000B9AE982|nr:MULTISPECIES: site-specific integrase [unclassified Rhodococcus (in: high G+C Gram-positive bacteria)]OZE29086.1 hypothetical protein CH278_19670 [Rhodococcus sp. 05-2254-5]OZE53780.1 hypothetical protein CH269_21955 [Rhodococcus sp. 05-2254-1]
MKTVQTIGDYLPDFVASHAKKRTAESYEDSVRSFLSWCEFLDDSTEPSQVTAQHVEAWIEDLEGKGAPRGTLATRYWGLEALFRYLMKSSAVDATPFAEMDNINARPLPIMPTLSRAELGRLVAESKKSTPSDEATVGLLALMGLTTTQAVEVLIEEFELTALNEMTLLLMNRSGDLVKSIVPSNLRPSIERAAGDRASGPLLLRRDGTRMVRTSVTRVVQRLSRKAGLDPKLAAESVRQSFIALRVEDGVPVWTIASEARIHEGTVRNHVKRFRLTNDGM